MMHQRSSRCATMTLFSLLLVLSTTVLAQDNQVYNPDRRSYAPAYEPSRLDLLAESFETTVPPEGWAKLSLGNADEEWEQSSDLARTGSFSAEVLYCPPNKNMDEWLVSPPLDFTSLTNIILEFYEDEFLWADRGFYHYVMVGTIGQTSTGSFAEVYEMSPSNHTIEGFDGDPVSVDLSAYAGESTVYVALRYTGSSADIWYVDDVRVYQSWLHDVQVASVYPNGMQYADEAVITPQIDVANIGRSTEDFDVQATILESGIQVYQETVGVTALAPETTFMTSFPTMTLSEGNSYEIHAVALLGTDMDTSNNEGTALNDTYTLPHVPLGILLTQSDCLPCAETNEALDLYIPTQGNDVAILRVHVWWPGTDALYDANTLQNNFLALGSGVDYAPHLRIDQILDVGFDAGIYASSFDLRKTYHSPMNIVHFWNPETEIVTVQVENVEPMPADWNLRLRVAITEDDVYEEGENGELYHDQTFRYMYPDTDGFVVPTSTGNHLFQAHCPVSAENWAYDKLRAVVYVQDNDTWKVHNSATGFLTELPDVIVAVDHATPALLMVEGNHPNPFNPETTIKYELSGDRQVLLSIFDVDGSLVTTLVNGLQTGGVQSVVWGGRDAAGRPVSSGTYFYRIDADGVSETRKMVMVK